MEECGEFDGVWRGIVEMAMIIPMIWCSVTYYSVFPSSEKQGWYVSFTRIPDCPNYLVAVSLRLERFAVRYC